MLDQRGGPLGGRRYAHVKHKCAGETGQRGIVERRRRLLFRRLLTGHEGDARCIIALGERNARVTARGLRRGNSRNDLVRHAGRLQRSQLLGQSGEDRWIATLEPHDRASLARMGNHGFVDFALRHQATVPMSAQADSLSIRPRRFENFRTGQVVVEHDIGNSQALSAAQCQQPGIAGPRADQKHFAELLGHET
jgi:hypothetical protein